MSLKTIQALQQAESIVHVVCSGAGTQLQRYLWEEPGASQWLSGASFPYSQDETIEFLGFIPQKFCAEKTAIQLASAAYMRAFTFGRKAIGVAITASVASKTEHRGDHRVHACVITHDKCYVVTKTIDKGTGFHRRNADDQLVSVLGDNLLAHAMNLPSPIENVREVNDEELRLITLEHPVFHASGLRSSKLTVREDYLALMPGAYNPPHDGHLKIGNLTAERFNKQVYHHVTIDSPHKPTLRAQEILERARLLKHHNAFFSVGDPLYIQKAKVHPGSTIVLGVDAALRMLDPKWGPEIEPMLREFDELGTLFIVSNRDMDNSTLHIRDIYYALAEQGINGFDHLFVSLGAEHWSYSSTEIRNALNVRSG